MIKSLNALFKNTFDDFDAEGGRAYFQRIFINSLSIIGGTPLAFFAVYNVFFGIKSLGLWEMAFTVVVIINFILFQRHQNIRIGSIAILVLMILFSLVLLVTGGIENTGIFWMFSFPALAFFLQGTFYGFMWTLLFIGINLTAAFLAKYGLFELSYSFVEVRQFLLSMLALSFVIYFYEKVVDSMNRFLQNTNAQLEEKVRIELDKNREKDFLLMQKSRQAQMGEMLAMIAHQWRQPLSSITATVGTLQIKQAMGKFDKEYFDLQLDNIVKYTEHLSHTIEDFRGFYLEEKKVKLSNLDDIIHTSASIVAPVLEGYDIVLETELGSHEEFWTYPNELKQVVLNLLKNSQEALVQNKVKDPKITISTYNEEGMVCFQIDDNAGGISEEIILKIFDPYFTTKGEVQGSGLGLYMSKKIIEEHCQGILSVDNTDKGVRFTCKLPRIDNDDS